MSPAKMFLTYPYLLLREQTLRDKETGGFPKRGAAGLYNYNIQKSAAPRNVPTA